MADPRAQYIESLKEGKTVQFRCNGNSMTPRIYPKDLLTIAPIQDYAEIKDGDAVFCKVRKSLTVHKVTGIDGKGENLRFQISNNHGHVNGWIDYKHVYGKLVAVEAGEGVRRKEANARQTT